MSLRLVFQPAARREYDDAADWYEARRAGLGAAFTVAVQQVLDRIADQPKFYAVALDDIREAQIVGYPYCVYYREKPDRVVILAVFHTSRDPAIWQGRAST